MCFQKITIEENAGDFVLQLWELTVVGDGMEWRKDRIGDYYYSDMESAQIAAKLWAAYHSVMEETKLEL